MEILENEPMNAHTTFKVGGPARFFIKVESVADIEQAQSFAMAKGLPRFILGKGSNILVSDSGFEGVIIQLGKSFSEIQDLGNGIFQVGGATPLARFARESIRRGFALAHKLAGIPGSVGGAVFMNAGA